MKYLPGTTYEDEVLKFERSRADIITYENERLEFEAFKSLSNLFPNQKELILYLRNRIHLLKEDESVDQEILLLFERSLNVFAETLNYISKGFYTPTEALERMLAVSKPLYHYAYMFEISVDVTPLYKPN